MGSRSTEPFALLTDYDQSSAYSQAFYRCFATIRSQWESEQALSADTPQSKPTVHTLLLTGVSASKDLPTVAANLAIVAAQSGAETLLVDTDLRSSALRQRFGLPQERGLRDLLEEESVTTQTIDSYFQPTFVPGLRVLGAGSPLEQSTSLLLSPRLKTVVAGIRSLLASSNRPSGIALFHSAPLLSGADAALIGALTEQTVLAVIRGQTTRTQARQAQEQLEQANSKLTGIIMLRP